MKFLQTPFKYGKLTLKNNIFYAPLAGCSDYPFRKMSALYQPGMMFCEMVKMDALIRNDPNTYQILSYHRDMHPIGGQLCGSKPSIAGQAAKIIEDFGFDEVNLNCGCPVDKVTKDGSGSGLLKSPSLIGDILCEMVAAVKIPVTVKIRAGWDENNIVAPLITQIAEEAGATAICVHGRTREQAYKGPANWDYIKQAKDAAKNILVIGNGDVVDGLSAEKMFMQTNCDAVLVARATLGQPWIVQDIVNYFINQQEPKRSLEDCRLALWQHFLYTIDFQPKSKALTDMRRIGCWYLKKTTGTKNFRELISKANNLDFVRDLIQELPMEEMVGAAAEAVSCSDEC
ncbi:MAG: tRNA dihydrouridine synthase DusB [Chlamydia sp. 32-24]|nr:MAG: tRNA dihydrouridine synthase DusB [Chlamydia sp. 32-24]